MMNKPDMQIWDGCIAHVRRHHPAISRQWFEDLDAGALAAGILNVTVAQPVRLRYLQRECADVFNEAIQTVTGRLITVRFLGPDESTRTPLINAPAPTREKTNGQINPPTNGTVGVSPPMPMAQTDAATEVSEESENRPDENRDLSSISSSPAARDAASGQRISGGTTWGTLYDDMVINPDYTFENFVQGPNNRMAYAAAQAVSDKPGQAYNPYFIHGGVGLGKTHLLQAICQTILQSRPDIRIYYVSCEGFASQLMEAVQAGQMADFRHRFRNIDVLMVDDIHFLGGQEQTQEEFFHTFNTLYQARKQIVLSSDAAPNEILDIEERLLSRFNQGLVAHLDKPSYETRVYILKTKARLRNIEVPDEVICYLADRVDSNIRELEGALTQVQGHAMVAERPIDLSLAQEALGSHGTSNSARIGIQDIISVVSRRFDVRPADLLSKNRNRSIVLSRQVAMYVARRLTDHSLQEIGGFFGGRDHTTVMHAISKIETKRANDDRLNRQITVVEDELAQF